MYTKELKRLQNAVGELWDLLAEHNAIIAGGAITSVFTNRPINDIDVYLRSEADFLKLIDQINNTQTRIVDFTKKAILLLHGESKVQLIVFDYFQDAAAVFDAFDFSCVMGAYDMRVGQFRFHPEFFYANSTRTLKFHTGTRYPLVSLMRVQKYTGRGYKISNAELTKIALAVAALNIDSHEELLDHMGGMYGTLLAEDIFDLSKPFDLETVMSELNEDMFVNVPNKTKGTVDLHELLYAVAGIQREYFEHKGKRYLVATDGFIEPINYSFGLIASNSAQIEQKPHLFKKVPAPKTVQLKKFVKPGLVSKYDSKFIYPPEGEVSTDNPKGLFFHHRYSSKAPYSPDVTIYAETDIDDIIEWTKGEIVVSKARIVSHEP